MTDEHLSALEFDEVAAGLIPRPPHLERCGSCRTHIDELVQANAAILETAEAKRRLAALVGHASRASSSLALGPKNSVPPLSRWRRVALVAAPLAAGVALLLAWPREPLTDGAQLKGGPAVRLLDGSNRSVEKASPGQTLTLAVGTGGFSHGAVFVVDAEGKAEILWPTDGKTYAPLPPGAEVRLIDLVVTPGDVTIKAVFANDARQLTRAGAQVRTVQLKVFAGRGKNEGSSSDPGRRR